METFHGFDFDTLTEAATEASLEPVDGGDVSFVRGLLYGLLFAVPCWGVVAGAVMAVF